MEENPVTQKLVSINLNDGYQLHSWCKLSQEGLNIP